MALAQMNDHRKHFVYEIWNDDTCLYVGCTVDPGGRLAVHGRKWWYEDVTHVTMKAYWGHNRARRAEADRIGELQPVHNVLHTEKALGPRHAEAG